jgi:hypothetical protein
MMENPESLFTKKVYDNLAFDEDPKALPADKTLMCLSLLARNINLAMLFGVSPYSEFYSDRAHPTFISRSINLLKTAIKTHPAGNKYFAKALLTMCLLENISSIANRQSLVEVSIISPILNLNFDNNGILVQTLDSELFRVKYCQLTNNQSSGVIRTTVRKLPINHQYFDFDRMFSFRTGETLCANETQIMVLNANCWEYAYLKLNGSFTFGKVVPQTQPAESFVYLQQDTSSYVMSLSHIVKQILHSELEKALDS